MSGSFCAGLKGKVGIRKRLVVGEVCKREEKDFSFFLYFVFFLSHKLSCAAKDGSCLGREGTKKYQHFPLSQLFPLAPTCSYIPIPFSHAPHHHTRVVLALFYSSVFACLPAISCSALPSAILLPTWVSRTMKQGDQASRKAGRRVS